MGGPVAGERCQGRGAGRDWRAARFAGAGPRRYPHRMATDKSPAAELARANLLVGGVAVLGDVAMAVGAALGKVTAADLDRAKNLEDASFMAFLAVGPFLVPAGIGLRRQHRWGRNLTLALGGTGVL